MYRLLLLLLLVGLFWERAAAFSPMIHHETARTSWRTVLSVSSSSSSTITDQTHGNSETPPSPSPRVVAQWHVYVDQSKASIDKGAAATLDAFIGLAPPEMVQVHAAIFQSVPSKVKGPLVRCVEILHHNNSAHDYDDDDDDGKEDNHTSCRSFEVTNVDSVDKVARILRKHMKLGSAVGSNAERLKWKYQGTSYLEKGKINLAIDCYDRALETSNDGMLFLLRAAAYLERAASHRQQLRDNVSALVDAVDLEALQDAVAAARTVPVLANPIFQRILQITSAQEGQFRRTQYRHGMYQYALLQAAQDAFRATQLLPFSADAWRRAADILSELWKLKEAVQYYEKAMELDDSIDFTANIQQIYKRQDLLESARAYGWSEDTLRLGLDVAR
jgi:tetratricopeptide (TPR) repeat protein